MPARSLLAGSLCLVVAAGCYQSRRAADAIGEVAELAVHGDARRLHERPEGAPPRSPAHPGLLVVALDGVGRDVLYDALEARMMPELEALLGGDLDRAYFEDEFLSVLPSNTVPGWVSAFTGAPPGVHGVPGNELFVRERPALLAPAPTSFDDPAVILENYTDGYLNEHIEVPTIYEQIRARDPHVLIWVMMNHVFRGVDQLQLTSRGAVVDALEAMVGGALTDDKSFALYEKLDRQVVSELVERLGEAAHAPDVLTVYFAGPDGYAHTSEQNPDAARQRYLVSVVDPLLGDLREALAERGELDDRYVIVTADHGHTEVVDDEAHALGTGEGEPTEVLERLGRRVRPARLEVDDEEAYDAVLAANGAFAFVYLANLAGCAGEDDGRRCDWSLPPRLEEDTLPVARAFAAASERGALVPELEGALDLVLVRTPDGPEPLAVIGDGGALVPLSRYLAANPRPGYLDLERRLRLLVEGPRGDRAGDVLLLARYADRETPEERHYFSEPYRSWHGGPAARDSRIPLILAHPDRSRAELGAVADRVLGDRRHLDRLTPLLLALRFGG